MKKISVVLVLSLLFFLLPQKVYALNNANIEVNSLSEDKKLQIESVIEEKLEKSKIPGMEVVIVKDDNIVYQSGFGYSYTDKQTKVNNETLFEIGSNTKAFTALGILKLESKGLIDLQDDVSKYIPWFEVRSKGKESSIKIAQLLNHTSGIPFKTIDLIPESEDENAIEKTCELLKNIELDNNPGEYFEYATINYDLLGLIIEKVTGESYEDYMQKEIIAPMGLNNTCFNDDSSVEERKSAGYKIGLFNEEEYTAPKYKGNTPAGYIVSNSNDIAAWMKIQLNENDDLIKKSHEKSSIEFKDGSSYYCGWYIGEDRVEHGGNNPNYSSYIDIDFKNNVGVAVLCNTNSEYVEEICKEINTVIVGGNYTEQTTDTNILANKIALFVIGVFGFLLLVVMFFIIKAVKEILTSKRTYKGVQVKETAFSLIIMIGIGYLIYKVPYIFFDGISWGFVSVWLPKSVMIALGFVCTCILSIYIYILMVDIYRKEKESQILKIIVLSVISGFGNALLIFSINTAISAKISMRYTLFIYFLIGIVFYVCSQKIVRKKLIDIANDIVYSKRMDIIKSLLMSSYKDFENFESGRIESTLNNDTESISKFINILISGITSMITIICCFIYLGIINIYVLLLSILIIVIISGIYYCFGGYADKVAEEARDLQNTFFKFINDLIYGFKELSINQKRRLEFSQDLEESCNKYKAKKNKSAMAFANMFVVGELLFTLAIGAVVFIFPYLSRNFEGASIESYVFILLYITGPVNSLLDAIPTVIEVKISLKRINSLINEICSSTNEVDEELCLTRNDNISLKLNKVEYEYDREEEKSFKVGPISYEFNSGEIIFITGGNGSGKSTLAKIMTGLYKPCKGEVTINDIVVSEKQLSQKYATVFADFYLFNKLYGIDYKSKEKDIKKYLELLQLDKKVEIKEEKFNTVKLSTGQKKRLALLVAYLDDKPIYLFDEWAADQDPEFRRFFYEELLPGLKEKGKCVIAITHDDRYFDLADKVIKMDMGKIKSGI